MVLRCCIFAPAAPLDAASACLEAARAIVEASPLYLSNTLRIDELSREERAVYATLKPERLPKHVAIIMDGNGRWAGHRLLKRFQGHQQGAKSVQLVTETASRIGLPWLTLYTFSLENFAPLQRVVRSVGIHLVIKVMNQSDHAPLFLVLAKLAGIGPYAGFHRQRVLAQILVFGVLAK